MPVMCFHQPAVEVTADITLGGARSNLAWNYDWTKLPPKITAKPNGDVDFSQLDVPIYVTFRLRAGPWKFYDNGDIHVMGFVDEAGDYGDVRPIKPQNHQVDIRASGIRQLSFCYRNHQKDPNGVAHKASQYVLYVSKDLPSGIQLDWIDPIISNGGNARYQ